jgi:vacuolar-type H+-ATPase subunit B/Vma2
VESSSAGGTKEEYVHLDDDLAYLELPTNKEAVESAAEQRALMVSFETRRRHQSVRRLMAAERRAAADEMAALHRSAHQSAHRRNLAAVDEAKAAENHATVVAERRLQAERARATELARVREHQYPLPSYYADASITEDAQHHWQQLREAHLRRRPEKGNHGSSGGSGAGGSDAY